MLDQRLVRCRSFFESRAWKYRQFLLYALRVHEEDCLDGSGNIHQFVCRSEAREETKQMTDARNNDSTQ